MALALGIDQAVELISGSVAKERCILFLGAGVHAPPPADSGFQYPDEQRPPIGSQLSRLLAEGCWLAKQFPDEDPSNLPRVSLFYELIRSRRDLVQAVTDAVQTGKTPSPLMRALAEMGFPLVITTNYDQLFEQSLQVAGRTPRVEVYSPDSAAETAEYPDPSTASPVVFKIHGDIAQPGTLVITDEDYIQFVLRMSDKEPHDPVPVTLKSHLTEWTTVFVGYSLVDYNLRLLFKTLRWKLDPAIAPDMYSIDFHPDPLILSVWDNQRRYVKFIAQDAWALVPKLYEKVLGKELSP
jgi:hypothetical protein